MIKDNKITTGMNNTEGEQNSFESEKKSGFSGMQVFGIIVAVITVTVIVTLLLVKYYFFPSAFKPVVLTPKEEQRLEQKLDSFSAIDTTTLENQSSGSLFDRGKDPNKDEFDHDGKLKPKVYSEEGANRTIKFTEREVNALLAKNTDLAEKLAIDFTKNIVSFKLLVPIDQDFPVMGGKTIRLHGGAELAYRQKRPIVKLKGISLMGVPIPNSWLGGIKNIDLVQEFGADEGFWKGLSDGVESVTVGDGNLEIKLKE